MMNLSEAMGGAPFCIGDLLDWPARFYGTRVAIEDNASVTYAELRERSIARSKELSDFGIERFQRWGLIADNSADFFILLFALVRLGAVAAPMQRSRTTEWLEQMAVDSNLEGVITPADFEFSGANLIPESWHEVVMPTGIRIFTAKTLDRVSHTHPVIDVDPALIIWSSGSTRSPRGVVLQHRSVLSNIRSNISSLGLRDEDRTLVVLPVAHAYALIHQCLCHLAVGATLFCPRQPLFAPSLCRNLEEGKITTLSTVPAMLKIFVEGLRATGRRCPELRLVTVGAGRVSKELLADAMDLLPATTFAITYGLTEAGPRVATLFVDRDPIDPACVGKPLPNFEVRIDATQDGISEIRVRSSSLMRSYVDEVWVEGGDHVLRTTDLGEFDEGRLYIRGRLDRSINRGGVLIAAEMIESVLLRHPDVMNAVVHAQSHPFWGQVPVATLSVRKGSLQSIEQLRRFYSRWLTSTEMPTHFVLNQGMGALSSKEQKMLAIFDERITASTSSEEQQKGSEVR